MNNFIRIAVLVAVLLICYNCNNLESQSVESVEKEFGLLEYQNDSLSADLNLDQFRSWKALLNRIEDIVCNDSLPKIILKNDSLIKNVYLKNPCITGTGCILIKERNTIEIHNDTISKWYYKQQYPLDSLAILLKKDLENNGRDARFSDSPEKFLIYISYDDHHIEKLPILLDKLTTVFEQLSDKKNLNIWLNKKFDIPPPPPPPKEPEGIELIMNDG